MSLDPFYRRFPGVGQLLSQKLAVPALPVEKLLLARGFELVPGLALAEFQIELWTAPQTLAKLDRRRGRGAHRGPDRRRPGFRFRYPEPVNLHVHRALARHGLTDWVLDLHLREWWVWEAGTLARFVRTACRHALSMHPNRKAA